MIIKTLIVGKFHVFCYILGCEKTLEGVVIDPGGDVAVILNEIERLGLSVQYIINTHFHADHTLGNAELQKKTGAKVLMHNKDSHMLNDSDSVSHFKREGLQMASVPDQLLHDNDNISMGDYQIKVVHTPGHSPGSICLLCAGNLFTGDSLFVGAAGRVDLPGGDFMTLTASLEEKLANLPDDTIIFPGHDYGDTPTSTIGREKKENPFMGGEW